MKKMNMTLARGVIASIAVALAVGWVDAGPTPAGTAFTYQGRLKNGGNLANGSFNMDFKLYPVPAGGTLLASQTLPGVSVSDGLFTVHVDFGAGVFDGNQRWLEVTVAGTPLAPRQELSAAPYALHSAAPWVTNGQDISYVNGAVGVGTSTPVHPLDVAGDTRLRERLAVGNDANFGIGWVDFDVSHIHTDFATSTYWTPFRSYITFDPNIDLSPPDSLLYSHDFECVTPAANDHNYNYLQGPYLGAFHHGGGHVALLAGGNLVAQTTGGGSVDLQIGGYIASILGVGGGGTGTIQDNHRLEIITGNDGAAGASLVNDYSIYVYSPFHAQPMTNHYGIYLEDQDFGQNDSFAIYSAGGDCYFGGNMGIGTTTPGFQLQLSQDSAAKPTSNTWTISSDARLKKNIHTIEHALDDLLSLRGVTYQWIDPSSQGDMAGTYTGMIAQDVEKVFPEWIREDANGYKTLTVIGFEGIVVEAMRQLRDEKDAELAALRAEKDRETSKLVDELNAVRVEKDNELAEMRDRVSALEAAMQQIVARQTGGHE